MLCQINSLTTIKLSEALLSWCLRCNIYRKHWRADVKTTQKLNSVKDICSGMSLQNQKEGRWHCCRALSLTKAVFSLSRSNISSDIMTAWAWGQTRTNSLWSFTTFEFSPVVWFVSCCCRSQVGSLTNSKWIWI